MRRMRELGVVLENGKLSQQDIPGLPYSQAQTYNKNQYLPPMEKHNPSLPVKSSSPNKKRPKKKNIINLTS